MNYMVVVPQSKFDISVLNWLVKNVSEHNHLWKAELDIWERRLVFFVKEEHSLAFKAYFKS